MKRSRPDKDEEKRICESRLKRLSSYETKRYQSTNARWKLESSIRGKRCFIENEEKKKVQEGYEKFVKEMGPLKPGPSDPIKYRSPYEDEKKKSKKQQQHEPLKLMDCLVIQELANIILTALGPWELFNFSRASKNTAVIAKSSFLFNAKYYIDRMGEDIYDAGMRCKEFERETDAMKIVLSLYEKSASNVVSLGDMLSIWAHCSLTFRQYALRSRDLFSMLDLREEFHVDYSFIKSNFPFSMVRLRDYSVYSTPRANYKEISRTTGEKWQEKYPLFDLSDERSRIKHFGYDELRGLELKPVNGFLQPKQTSLHILLSPTEIDLVEKSVHFTSLFSVVPPKVRDVVINCAPFLDYYEISVSSSKWRAFKFPTTLKDHVSKVAESLAFPK